MSLTPKTDEAIIQDLIKALEAGVYGGISKEKRGLIVILSRLGLKSATNILNPAPLSFAPLSSILSSVTFTDKDLKLWKTLNGTTDDGNT